MKILVTNDDGYTEGLKVLFSAAKKFGSPYAIVPERQKSAVSGALTLHKPLRLYKVEKDMYEMNGNPADSVLLSVHSKEFETPELVLSGVNWGDNTGLQPLISSGTLGACWQAAIEGIPSAAFSLYRKHRDYRNRDMWNSKKLRKYVDAILKKLKNDLRPHSFYSVNLPDDLTSPKIIMMDSVQMKRYKTVITKKYDPHGTPYYWITGAKNKPIRETDFYEVTVNKNITITEISLHSFLGMK